MRLRSLFGGLVVPVLVSGCSGDDTVPNAKQDAAAEASADAAQEATSDAIAAESSSEAATLDAADAGMVGDTTASDGSEASNPGDAGHPLDAGDAGDAAAPAPQRLPTGDFITPLAARGSKLLTLNPGLTAAPGFLADHATSSVTSPDGKTLLVLTSGYNMLVYPSGVNKGNPLPGENGEWIFVYDVSGGAPVQKQVLSIPNSFSGIAFHPNGQEFFVSGGKDDNVHVFDLASGAWSETTVATDAGPSPAIALGHTAALGLGVGPQSGGVAVNASGTSLVVANYENDSISLVTLATKAVRDLDLRPGKASAAPQPGVAGGEYPFWVVVKGETTAYVSSQRDREVDVVDLSALAVVKRIAVGGQPNKMILNKDQSRLFVANGNSDTVSVIDTTANTVVETIAVAAPTAALANGAGLKGANPNGLALSPDEKTLYVTDGATNAVAVVQLGSAGTSSATVGLIPTGWYPTAVSTNLDGSYLYVANAKSVPGPGCLDRVPTGDGGAEAGTRAYDSCWNGNDYVWTLEKAGLLSMPVPSSAEWPALTQQVADNDHFTVSGAADATMAFLKTHIQHVIFVIKENRTYDQILGDLGQGNGDKSLAMFPADTTPNFHALAKRFVDLDAFLDTGETSGVGWNWTTAAHATDAIERNQPINYGKGGLSYDWEGTNRNINVGLATLTERLAAMAGTPNDPDLLPGAVDVSAPEGPGGEVGTGYLWDAALRKNLSVRNYGVFVDLARYQATIGGGPNPLFIPVEKTPFAAAHTQAFSTNKSLVSLTDPYYRGFDMNYPDMWRYGEWKREFDGYVTGGNLPALETVRLPHDHTGAFGTAAAGVNTPILQVADNDAAVGALVAAVAGSPYASNTLVFVVEDDAQDGPDHVDAHRSTAFVVGPYVKTGAVVSTPYNTISMVRTIEEILGLDPLGLYDAKAAPMTDVFDTTSNPAAFTYTALVAAALNGTTVLAQRDAAKSDAYYAALLRGHDAKYWARVMRGQDFSREDHLDAARFNRALWRGLMGRAPYPTIHSNGRDDDVRPALLRTGNPHT